MAKNDRNFKKLSENARKSLRMSDRIADELLSNEVTPMHLFVGILLNKDSLGSRTMVAIGVDPGQTVNTFTDKKVFDFDRRELKKVKEIKLSKESRDIIRIAYSISSKFSHVYVGTEHILMAILQQKNLVITKELEKAGLSYEFLKDNLVNFATYPVGILAKPGMDGVSPSGMGGQSPLDILGTDLTALAADGKLNPLVGRDDELDQVINVLSRRGKNNPIIVGEPGVGKTAVVEGLAQMIDAGLVPNSLQETKIIMLDLSAIVAGSKLRGDVEEKMMAIIQEVVSTPNVILFIDEIHNILGPSMQGGGMDLAAVLKPALVRDEFRVIGATTSSEYTKYFEEDNALVRRFQPIVIDEPSIKETVEILERVEPLLEKHHNVNISKEAIESAVKLSDRYVSDRFLPDKAIDLLDEAAASQRLQLEVKYKGLADVVAEKHKIIAKKEAAVLAGDMDGAKKLQSEEARLVKKLETLEKSRSKSKNTAEFKVDVETIQRVVSKWTGIPVNTIDNQETTMLQELEDNLETKVVGQDEAVESVASAIKRARTGISAIDRPWASLLFLGPTGVGKTELAKVLTKLLFGDEDRLIQIDMSEMMEMHSVSKLIGSPPGYVGYKEGGQLTEKIRRKPHSVILFDEIEKAHPDVLNILLQIMEYGHLTDGKGRKVNFKNTVVVLTSNIGAEEIQKDKVLGFAAAGKKESRSDEDIDKAYGAMKDDLMAELKKALRPELLNRLDDVIIFRSLTRKDARMIVDILVDELNERLEDEKVEVKLSSKVSNYIVEEGFSEEYGARNLRRVLQDKVEDAVADYMLAEGLVGRSKARKTKNIKLDLKDNEVFVL